MAPHSARDDATGTDLDVHLEEDRLTLPDALTLDIVERHWPSLERLLSDYSRERITIDLSRLTHLDSAGVVALNLLRERLETRGIAVAVEGGSESIEETIALFTTPQVDAESVPQASLPERVGEATRDFISGPLRRFIVLSADLTFWTVSELFPPRHRRRGDFINQSVQIGVNALPIVGTMAFLIGLVLALQSAAQLRQFGANILIVDLTVIAMMREMGPLITAIIVAGRSASAIASELATMKVTEEIDALITMGFRPVRFVVVPKMQAAIFTMPFLTILATLMGIAGGAVVANFFLDIPPRIFFARMGGALVPLDIVTGLIKSLVFAGIIVVTGSYFGFGVQGGSEGVGRVTTAAVVVAISQVIVADSILGLMFY